MKIFQRLRKRLDGGPPVRSSRRWSPAKLSLVISLILLLSGGVYFTLGSIFGHRIDDDTAFQPAPPAAKSSHAVNMAAALISREVLENSWAVNDPWFAPRGLIDDGANFQAGIMSAVARFSYEMLDQMGRSRGSSKADVDLERAAGLLQFPGDVWVFDFRHSIFPTVPSEDQYRAGLEALRAYNARLANGQAVFERRADAFASTIARVANDLGSQSAFIDLHLKEEWFVINTHADDIFFKGKGKLYAYYLLLRELGQDFEPVIQAGGLKTLYNQALETLKHAATMHPMMVLDGSPNNGIFANHLTAQGFYLTRAVLQLNEVVKVLAI